MNSASATSGTTSAYARSSCSSCRSSTNASTSTSTSSNSKQFPPLPLTLARPQLGGKRSALPSLPAGQKQQQQHHHHHQKHHLKPQALSTPARNALPSQLGGKPSARPSLPSGNRQHHHYLQQSPVEGQQHEREEGESGDMDLPADAAVPLKSVEDMFGEAME